MFPFLSVSDSLSHAAAFESFDFIVYSRSVWCWLLLWTVHTALSTHHTPTEFSFSTSTRHASCHTDSWVTAALRRATGSGLWCGYRDFGAAAMPKRAT